MNSLPNHPIVFNNSVLFFKPKSCNIYGTPTTGNTTTQTTTASTENSPPPTENTTTQTTTTSTKNSPPPTENQTPHKKRVQTCTKLLIRGQGCKCSNVKRKQISPLKTIINKITSKKKEPTPPCDKDVPNEVMFWMMIIKCFVLIAPSTITIIFKSSPYQPDSKLSVPQKNPTTSNKAISGKSTQELEESIDGLANLVQSSPPQSESPKAQTVLNSFEPLNNKELLLFYSMAKLFKSRQQLVSSAKGVPPNKFQMLPHHFSMSPNMPIKNQSLNSILPSSNHFQRMGGIFIYQAPENAALASLANVFPATTTLLQ
ncbi:hypothetical protein ACTFIU_001845 [Dictyostelium citrinum]